MYQHVRYRMQSIHVNLQLLSRYFSYRIIFLSGHVSNPKGKIHDSIGRNFGNTQRKAKKITTLDTPILKPLKLLWSIYWYVCFWFYSVSIIWILDSIEFPRVGSPQPLFYTINWWYTTQSGSSKGDVKAIVTAVSLTTFDNIEWPKMWNRQLQVVGLASLLKSHLQEERQQIAVLWSPQSPFEHCRCFDEDTKGADGAADLLEVLRNSPLEKLNFALCSQIPSAAWQKLRGTSWTNLREADFTKCLVL